MQLISNDDGLLKEKSGEADQNYDRLNDQMVPFVVPFLLLL